MFYDKLAQNIASVGASGCNTNKRHVLIENATRHSTSSKALAMAMTNPL
jgi:hypothetical protein